MKPHRYSVTKASLLILLSVVVVTGSTLAGWVLYQHYIEKRKLNPAFNVLTIRQSCPDADRLLTEFFVRELGLTSETNLFAIDLKSANHHLNHHPLLKKVDVQRVPPRTLSLSYSLRKPIAFVDHLTNTAIDDEGVLFPFSPFYTPKHLPIILFPDAPTQWGEAMSGPSFGVARWLLHWAQTALSPLGVRVSWIDLSHAWNEAQSQEEVFLSLIDDEEQITHLRLPREHLPQALANALTLFPFLPKQPSHAVLVDVRTPHLATIKEVPMSEWIEISWTTDSIDEARRVCRYLVQERLVACTQIIPWVESTYLWNDQVETAQESKVVLKTEKQLFEKIEKMILENTTYEIPEITFRTIEAGHAPYFEWMEGVTV